MGTINKPEGAQVKRQVAITSITGFTAAQIQNEFNNNWGSKGWYMVQAIVIGANTFLVTEKEI